MDWHKLQHKLFEMDPTDPREDLRKLRESVQKTSTSVKTINYLEETAKVKEGSLPINGLDLEAFARLAGVTLTEKQKTGSAGQAKGSDPMPAAKPGRTKHPLKDKLVGEEDLEEGPLGNLVSKTKAGYAAGKASPQGFNAARSAFKGELPDNQPKKDTPTKLKGSVSPQQLNRLLGVNDPASFTQAIQKIRQPGGQKVTLPQQAALADAFVKLMAMDPQKTTQVMQLLRRIEAESIEEKKNPEPPKQRNPVAAYAQKSGAGVHKDQNKKNIPPRKEKHKSKSLQYESIKDRLWDALNRNK